MQGARRGSAADGGSPVEARDGAPSDQALVRAVRDGDEDAFALLYARYEPVARRSARRAARRHPQLDVEEVTNLAITRLWQVLDRFDDERDFAPWAAVVLSHAVRSAAERTRSATSRMNWGAMLAGATEDERDRLSELPGRGGAGSDGLESVLLDEQERVVAAVLQEVLSPREAKVVRLRLAGWTYSEIADRLELDTKAVDNALRRGMARLREAFSDGRVEAVMSP
ncbi:RNA polymerase sigma factor [Euzebya rosea]|uniref:RNA polymerase sigma factor n=1 Tax=Euzebya rosea TaxID=2052804 RepID=UPI0013004F9A|nr:sigma-70 family RNA polymerase sigma factor [Euzebya rosea]